MYTAIPGAAGGWILSESCAQPGAPGQRAAESAPGPEHGAPAAPGSAGCAGPPPAEAHASHVSLLTQLASVMRMHLTCMQSRA